MIGTLGGQRRGQKTPQSFAVRDTEAAFCDPVSSPSLLSGQGVIIERTTGSLPARSWRPLRDFPIHAREKRLEGSRDQVVVLYRAVGC